MKDLTLDNKLKHSDIKSFSQLTWQVKYFCAEPNNACTYLEHK